MMRDIDIDETKMSKFKFHSKTFYLKLKQFYGGIQELERLISIYMNTVKNFEAAQ